MLRHQLSQDLILGLDLLLQILDALLLGLLIGAGLILEGRLRRSREMTLLCSPKVTQHHQAAGAAFGARQESIMPVWKHECRESDRSRISPFGDVCDRSRLRRRRSRRALAQMMEIQTARCRVDDIAGTLQPTGKPVLRVGHSKRAEVDQFC
jgi:hypothetical protein